MSFERISVLVFVCIEELAYVCQSLQSRSLNRKVSPFLLIHNWIIFYEELSITLKWSQNDSSKWARWLTLMTQPYSRCWVSPTHFQSESSTWVSSEHFAWLTLIIVSLTHESTSHKSKSNSVQWVRLISESKSVLTHLVSQQIPSNISWLI